MAAGVTSQDGSVGLLEAAESKQQRKEFHERNNEMPEM
jgi:hypothetical protein